MTESDTMQINQKSRICERGGLKHSGAHSRGSIILVLVIMSLLLLAVLSLGTLGSININFMRSQVEYYKAQQLARAAVAQFLYDFEEVEAGTSPFSDCIDSSTGTLDLRKRYNNYPPLVSPAMAPEGEVSITFDETRRYYSTDNSLSETAVPAWRDRGSKTTSLPPFTIDLVINVKTGGSVRHFEAVISRRWEYAAFCARGPIVVTGTGVRGAENYWPIPSYVKGSLLSLYDPLKARISSGQGGDGQNGGRPGQQSGGPGAINSPGAAEFYSKVEAAKLPSNSICVGGQGGGDTGNTVEGKICTTAQKASGDGYSGSLLSLRDLEPLRVNNGNTLQGSRQYSFSSALLTWERNPLTALSLPSSRAFTEIDPKAMKNEFMVWENPPTLTMVGGKMRWLGRKSRVSDATALLMQYKASAQSDYSALPADLQKILTDIDNDPSVADAGAAKNKAVEDYIMKKVIGQFCYLQGNLVLQGKGAESRFYIHGNISNHMAEYKMMEMKQGMGMPLNFSGPERPLDIIPAGEGLAWVLQAEQFSQCGIILRDCTLFVDGDLELLDEKVNRNDSVPVIPFQVGMAPNPKKYPSIEGSNATLIVSGNVKISGGSLDSKDKGMVIQAKNMECATRGDYKGLILTGGALTINSAPKEIAGAAVVKPEDIELLNITGGIASLGEVAASGPGAMGPGPPGGPELEGLVLKSVNLTYSPRYLKALHRYGRPQVIMWDELYQ